MAIFRRSYVRALTLCCMILLLAGCNLTITPATPGAVTPVPAETPTLEAGDAVGGAYQPVDNELCEMVRMEMAAALSVAVERSAAPVPFQGMIDDLTGASCQLSATGTGEDFSSFIEVANSLISLLEAQGWMVDTQYVADGPTGTVIGLRRDNLLAVVAAGWDPAQGVTCPEDEPISSCAEELEPAQMIYTITVDLVETMQS